MDLLHLETLLTNVKRGKISVQTALDRLRTLPFEDLGYAALDHHRAVRQGFPEVILCEGKTEAQILGITKSLLKKNSRLLMTRANPQIARALKRLDRRAIYHELARSVVIQRRAPQTKGDMVIVTAGTADIPVAEEANVTATVMGSRVETLYDIGVAGLHRLLEHIDRLRRARVLIVVAGMDGVLPSVVSGILPCPVIAVPTSQGYGASFGGLAPLLTMLNACSGGVGVVNIDNGFGAACLAHRINMMEEPR